MILLQILDEGSLTNSQGREVDFKVHLTFFQSALLIEMMLQNSIVCLMSNLGSDVLAQIVHPVMPMV
jgi:ATP-dependent Clp protease ATP-binding subunit ClpA